MRRLNVLEEKERDLFAKVWYARTTDTSPVEAALNVVAICPHLAMEDEP